MMSETFCIKDGVVVEVDVHIDVTLDKFYRKFEDEIRNKVESRISSFFSLNNWDYGQSLKAVDIIKSISDIHEINNIEITLQSEDENNSGQVVTTRFYEIIRQSTVVINFVYE